MMQETATKTVARRSGPPGWLLCSLYIPLTSGLCAGATLAIELLWQSLASRGMIAPEDLASQILMGFVMMATVTAILLLVFLLFRALFKVKLRRLSDRPGARIATIFLFCVAYFLFFSIHAQISPLEGIFSGEIGPSFIGPALGYIVAADWPLWSLLTSDRAPDSRT